MVDAKIGEKVALIDVKLNAKFEAILILVNHQQIALVPYDIDINPKIEGETNEIEKYTEVILKALQSHFKNNR